MAAAYRARAANGPYSAEAFSDAHALFLKVTGPHDGADVVLVCHPQHGGTTRCSNVPSSRFWPAESSRGGVRGQARDVMEATPNDGIVEFHCHMKVLKRTCSIFADRAEFESLSATSWSSRVPGDRVVRIDLDSDDDIVFEVLRFIYCGSVYFPLGFRSRFVQFLAAVDYLGIEDMAARTREEAKCDTAFRYAMPRSDVCGVDGEAEKGKAKRLGSILEEPGFVQWLQDLPTEDILGFLRDERLMGCAPGVVGVAGVGFSLRRRFLTRLAELRPQDLTVDVLGEFLYRRLVHAGSPAPLDLGQESSLTGGRLLLPGSVICADLGASCEVRAANVGGLERVASVAALAGGPGRLWHGGQLLDPNATRASLLVDSPPHSEVVAFRESTYGQIAFDATLRRAESRPVEEACEFVASVRRLVDQARLLEIASKAAETSPTCPYSSGVDPKTPSASASEGGASSVGCSGYRNFPVKVKYKDPHSLERDLVLCRDSPDAEGGPARLVVLGVRPGGPAERAGIGWGWYISQRPEDLVVSAPAPGHGNPFSAGWSSLQGLHAELRAPEERSLVTHFDARPFGFSWTQEGEYVVIREVKPNGRAMQKGVHRGMVLKSVLPAGEPEVITDVKEIMKVLRSNVASASLAFGWRTGRKSVATSNLVGLTFEERTTSAVGAGSNAGGPPVQNMDSKQHTEERCILVSRVPAGHPATRDGIGPGWQLMTASTEVWESKPLASLEQMPHRLKDPNVVLEFLPPPALSGLLPVDEIADMKWPPEAWQQTARGAILAAAPWQRMDRHDIGPLTRLSGTVLRPCGGASSASNDGHQSWAWARMETPSGVAENQQASGEEQCGWHTMHHAGGSSSSSSTACGTKKVRLAEGGREEKVAIDVIVLGKVPPESRIAQWRIDTAGPGSGLLWELRSALEAVGSATPQRARPRQGLIAAVLLRRKTSTGVAARRSRVCFGSSSGAAFGAASAADSSDEEDAIFGIPGTSGGVPGASAPALGTREAFEAALRFGGADAGDDPFDVDHFPSDADLAELLQPIFATSTPPSMRPEASEAAEVFHAGAPGGSATADTSALDFLYSAAAVSSSLHAPSGSEDSSIPAAAADAGRTFGVFDGSFGSGLHSTGMPASVASGSGSVDRGAAAPVPLDVASLASLPVASTGGSTAGAVPVTAATRRAPRNWVGGIVLGESVAQIVFRWALHVQQAGVEPQQQEDA